ncbi:transcriptional regulator SlyA [Hartmannibacter diazotrophicus]|uniref:Transcriptional regulator SlyA n=1 Tax=Hartmannibacter diazotrophicus TaxID=1482074 RepID=A0A2C9DD22_9HYPH|nr:MarR family winged helix-turn-helix transcriptional regulator [Hartmannibacter diazotrophicus]SON57641.1 transcriptional regulator SlyA [Hartmannibacter diazotrophicus]
MSFNHRKTVTYRLTQAARAHRTRAAMHLARIGLHPGQEAVLKALADGDGQSMSELATELGVQPPTVTKMIARLGVQGLVLRQVSDLDGRLARVYLTDKGREKIDLVNTAWKRIEREALAGLEDKDRKRLRKLLRAIEKNLAPGTDDLEDADEIEAETTTPGTEPEAEGETVEAV